MRTILLAALVAGAVATSASAQSADRYISVGLGAAGSGDYSYALPIFATTRMEAQLQPAAGAFVSYGQGLGSNLRGEIALAYRAQDIEGQVVGLFPTPFTANGEFTALSLDLNLFYDLPVKGPVRPYVGAGVGVADVSLDDPFIDDNGSTLNLQAMAGASLRLNARVELFAEARYQRLGTITIQYNNVLGGSTTEEEFSISSGAAFAGVRVGF